MNTPTARELVDEARDIGFTHGEIATLTKILEHLRDTPEHLITTAHMAMYCEIQILEQRGAL